MIEHFIINITNISYKRLIETQTQNNILTLCPQKNEIANN